MAKYTGVTSTYLLDKSYEILIESFNKFNIPEDQESSALEALREYVDDLIPALRSFINAEHKHDKLTVLGMLKKLETTLLSLKLWNNLDFDPDESIEEIENFKVTEWEDIEELVAESLDLTRSYAMYLAPSSLIELNRQLTHTLQLVSDLRDENSMLKDSLSSLEISNLELVNSTKAEISDVKNKAISQLNSITVDVNQNIDSKLQDKIHLFETLQNDYTRALNSSKQEFESQLEGLNSKLESAIKKEVRTFANQKEKLTQVLGSLSEFRRAKSDIAHADEQRTEADKLRKSGLRFMALPMIAFFVFFVSLDSSATSFGLKFTLPPDFSGYFLRFLTILLFSSPSVYMLKESAYHRKQELIYRNRGVQLGSIGAYLDDVPPEMKNKLKSDLVKFFYGPVDNSKADVSHVPDIIQQIKEVAQVSKSLSKVLPINQSESKNNSGIVTSKEQIPTASKTKEPEHRLTGN
ncbi:hypothetical protein ACSG95_003264 [Vibrio alginolyticus]